MNSKQNPVLQINPDDNHESVDILFRDSSPQSSLRSHRSRENRVDQDLKRLQREIRRLQVRGNPRDSPSHSFSSSDRSKHSRRRRKTPPRQMPRR